MVMKAAPSSAFIMTETELLLELLIIALDAPAQLGKIDHLVEGHVVRNGGEPVLGRSALARGPFDEKPLFRPAFGELGITMRRPHAEADEPRGHPIGGAFAPRDRAPSAFGQTQRQRLDRDRSMLGVAAKAGRRLSTA